MVNTGKPSRGCYMCRARRIKCDEAKPSCMRCQKSKRVCPGYRDAFELKLRDESKSTKKKLNRRLSEQQSSSSDIVNNAQSYYGPNVPSGFRGSHSRGSSMSSVSSQMTSKNQNKTLMPYHHKHSVIATNMTTPIQQQAACYFLSNFVLVPESGTMRGYMDFILPLMKQKNPQTALMYAFSAVTLAALGTRPNSKGLTSTADLWYLKALKEINAALKDPKLASSEATLASVMLMASFEQLTPSRMKVGGWSSHIDGAVAMIKSCPIERWSTGIGRDLFIAVRAHMTLQCIANSKNVDTEINWLGVEAYDDIVQSFAILNLKMAALRADNDQTTTLKTHTAENVEKVLKLLRRAEALDQDYMDWIKDLPPNWEIKTVSWIDGEVSDLENSLVHPGRVDAYGELWMAYKYNIVRGCRLFIWTVILRCVAWLGDPRDYRLTPEYAMATRVCQQLVEDIVSSVPYFFGWNRTTNSAMADKSNFACGATDYTAVRPLAGLFVMWPLFAAASSDFASPSQRIFLRARLKYVAEIMGINQALIMWQAQLVHPSLYIARERMNLQPTTCHSSDTQEKIVSGVPAAAIIVNAPTPPASQDGVTWTASPISKGQTWVARQPSPPEQAWKATATTITGAPSPPEQVWQHTNATTTHHSWNTSVPTPPQDQTWKEPTPPQDQLWQPLSPPQDQLWSASTSSPPYDMWKTSSPPHTKDHLWSPEPTISQQLDQIYSLPISAPREQIWHQAPGVRTVLSCTGDLLPVHDPGQVWSSEFEDSAPSWLPRTFTDMDMFEQENGMSSSQVLENEKRYSKGFGVVG